MTIETSNSVNDIAGYFLISKRWTMDNDKNITFVREKSLGYCYNLKWAGPIDKSEIEKLNKNKETTVAVSYAILKPFLVFEKNEFVVPNTSEVRKKIGLDTDTLKYAN
ncbi:hypothetical protein [Flavobacterium sp. 7A]|uniref:hypothetical protein n=1 Tax=Flavobacterium sp. 7A TaxID=2940571 RepID=UPI0022275E51|nr:hypothetical protein [Flavobacterium sp. 7A]MCW2118133.1 hypothetical protein [Flavobacterium sp. 7A]